MSHQPDSYEKLGLALDHCPICYKKDFEGGSIHVNSGRTYQSVGCSNCFAEWDDEYTLIKQTISFGEYLPITYKGLREEAGTQYSFNQSGRLSLKTFTLELDPVDTTDENYISDSISIDLPSINCSFSFKLDDHAIPAVILEGLKVLFCSRDLDIVKERLKKFLSIDGVVTQRPSLMNKTPNISCELDVSEEVQVSSFQNATLHSVNSGLACSIAVYPLYPNCTETERQAAEYLKASLAPLVSQGWSFEIQIGQSDQEENSCTIS